MKFVISKELHESTLIRLLVIFFLIFLALFFGFQPFLEQDSFGLNPLDIVNRISGNEELFIPAMRLAQIFETLHIDLFMRLIAALSLLAICVRLIKSRRLLFFIIFALNTSILLNALSPVVIHLGLSWFAYVKVGAYWLQEALFSLLVIYALFKMIIPQAGRACE